MNLAVVRSLGEAYSRLPLRTVLALCQHGRSGSSHTLLLLKAEGICQAVVANGSPREDGSGATEVSCRVL